MADPEHFNLAWNQFETCAGSTFKSLLSDEDFTDVTLACEGDEQLSAHKVILSSCSPFFRKVLLKNRHQHPLIYLKGVKFKDLQMIMKFIYLGQIEIGRENLPEFLATAKELEVKGLMEANDVPSGVEENGLKSPLKEEVDEVVEAAALEPHMEIRENENENETGNNKLVVAQDVNWGEDGFYSGSGATSQTPKDKTLMLKPEFKSSSIFNTTPINKNPEGKFPCNECEYKAQTPGNLKRHRLSKHSGERVPCLLCGKDFASKDGLKVHHQNKHEGLMFGCQLCDHEATTKSNLLRHMHKKHNQPARGLKHANTSILDSNGYDSTMVYDNALSNDKASNGNESAQNETAKDNKSEVEPANFYMESVME